MAGINDIAFRILCKNAGAGLVFSGMINPLTREELVLDDKPAIQIFSADEKGIAEFIRKNEKNAQLFDFNLGCSAHIVEKNKFGMFLPDKIKAIEKILKIMKNSTKKPIIIKIRKSNQALKIAKIAEKYCDAVCIHPRTKEQGYSGEADVSFAEKIKKKISIPVIYSGDADEKNADELLKKFDFVMIGRRAIGYPNIFAKLTGNSQKFGFKDYLELALKYELKFPQIKSQAIFFTKYCEDAKHIREELAKAKKLGEIKKILKL